MAKLNLILADKDKNYIQGLSNYILNNYNDKFNIICLTDKELFIEELKKLRKKDVLVVGDSFYVNTIENLGIRSVLILNSGSATEDKYEYPVIKKYQTGADICKEILRVHSEYNPKNIERVTNNYSDTKIISFYSPIGGSGKSILASGTAMALARSGDDILYLNLEDIQTTKVYFKGASDYTLSDLIYLVKEKDEDFKEKFSQAIIRDKVTNVLFFNSTESILDIEDITVEDITWFITELYNMNMFKYVIIDTSSKYNSVYNVILNSSSYNVIPVLKDRNSVEKIVSYAENTGDLQGSLFLYNKSNLALDLDSELSDKLDRENIDIRIQIPVDNNLNFEEGIGILNSSSIYNGVCTIINALAL
ncbi:AAA family ATPase [Clostridium chrysemydis]|uniref:AAA family ATPase n=1 Tax=Clostridium chrysemydis TaxID=2665504 RepID=UPI003F397A54